MLSTFRVYRIANTKMHMSICGEFSEELALDDKTSFQMYLCGMQLFTQY